jgi:hypothetical protein
MNNNIAYEIFQLLSIHGEFTEYFAKLKGSITETSVEGIGVTSEY